MKGTTIINNYAVDSTSDSGGRFLNTPLDIIFYLSIINNVFSVMGGAWGLYPSSLLTRQDGGGFYAPPHRRVCFFY